MAGARQYTLRKQEETNRNKQQNKKTEEKTHDGTK